MSDFYLIYVDDYGDSSSRLNDPKQPIFSLTAAFVKAEEWMSLELDLLGVIERFEATHGISLERLHAVEIYQRSGEFRKLDIGLMLNLFEEILTIFSNHQVKFISALTEKQKLREYMSNAVFISTELTNKEDNYFKSMLDQDKFMIPSYVHSFAEMMSFIDIELQKLDAYGVLIIDQQEEFKHFESTPLHRYVRVSKGITRILENPFYRDSRVQLLLCVPDFIGYVVGGVKHDELKSKERPKLKQWLTEIIQTMQLSIEPVPMVKSIVKKHAFVYAAYSMESMFPIQNKAKIVMPVSIIKDILKNE